MDLREAAQHEMTFKNLYKLSRLGAVVILGTVAILSFKPSHESIRVAENSQTTVEDAIPQTTVEDAIPPDEPTMTRKEFDSIKVGKVNYKWLWANYGRSEANVNNDSKEFVPADEGGEYWFFFDDDQGDITRKIWMRPTDGG